MAEEKKHSVHEEYAEYGAPFFPHHLMKEMMVAILAFALLITLATFFPAPREIKADPYVTPEGIKPEWYFLAAYQGLKVAEKLEFLGQWAPKTIGILGQGLVFLLLILLPFLDRNPERNPANRKVAMTVAGFLLILAILLTIWGHYSH